MEISELKKLFLKNWEIIEQTGLRNCHCFGLNSFIINETPRIRLFITEPNCELYVKDFQYEKYIKNPIIPIHMHKYNDHFIQLEGGLTHYIYGVINDKIMTIHDGISFNSYQYSRLGDETKINKIGKEKLYFQWDTTNINYLPGDTLHTVSVEGDRCSWLIIETTLNKDFNQICYHKNLKNKEGLYVPFNNPVDYLMDYFE